MITRREVNTALFSGVVLATAPGLSQAQAPVNLPPPQTDGGLPLMQAFKQRRSSREFSERPLPAQVLSNLLWAAWGINRPQSGLRTAPSSHTTLDIDLYLAMADGVWIYDPKAHRIIQHMPEDVRTETTMGQPFVAVAPLNLVYVSDTSRMESISAADRALNGIAHSAVIAQNVYLFCASEGLGTVVRASVPAEKLAQRLKLAATQKIYLAQTVGYPKS